MSRESVGVAFIGVSIVAEMHARGVAANPRGRLIGAYDPQTWKAAALTEKFGGSVFQGVDDLPADARVDAVHVLNPTKDHVPTGRACSSAWEATTRSTRNLCLFGSPR